MICTGLIKTAKTLYKEFCKVYGNIVSMDVVIEFLAQVDDLRAVNKTYVRHLLDYALDFDLIGC